MLSRVLVRCSLFGALLFSAAANASAGMIVAPYYNDFSVGVGDFSEATDTQWMHHAINQVYNNVITSADTASAATVQVTNLGGPPASASDFTMSTKFLVNSAAGSTTTVGFKALGDSAGTAGAFYLADVQLGADKLRLYKINPNASLKEEAAGFDVTANVPYLMTLTGTYSPVGNLTLDLTLTDLLTPANTKTISTTVAAVGVLQGQHFGLRDRTTGGGSTLNVDFDDFSITSPVPEPSTLALAALAMAGLAVCWARTSRRKDAA